MPVRERILQILEDRGMKQAAVARKMNEDFDWVNTRLRGVVQIKADELPHFAQALGVSACSLLGEAEQQYQQAQEPHTAEHPPIYLHPDAIAKEWAALSLKLSEREVRLLVDFMEFQQARE